MKSICNDIAVSGRAALFAGVALAGLASSSAAFAQTTQAARPAASPSAEADDAKMGNEIVVTATKREQTLQDVPVAVSVTTADQIERAQIRDIKDLQSLVPSLRVSTSQNSTATTYSIRGFGTSANNFGFEPSVAMFVDGVYRSRSISQIGDLPDIERVEVLRGPQSTLFGKNASAGVISLVSKKPQFQFGGNLEASYGNFNAVVVKGTVTGPISDTLAASISGGYNRRDGYVKNLANGDDLNNRNRWFVRGQLLFVPSDALTVRLIGDYDKIDEKCCAVFNLRRSAASGAVLGVGGQLNDPAKPFADVVYSDVIPFNKVRNWGLSGQIDYDLGPVTLTSITAYRDTQLQANQDSDYSSARLATGANIGQAEIKTFTQEMRLATNLDGPFNVLLGGYYFNESAVNADQTIYGPDFRPFANLVIGGPFTSPPNDFAVDNLENAISGLTGQNYTNQFFQAGQGLCTQFRQKNEAYSIFGNVDFDITDRLTVTLGANYTHDRKDVTSSSVSTDVFSSLDLVAIGQTALFYGALGSGASVADAQAYAIANASNPLVNPLLGLRGLQFQPPVVNFPNAVESGKTRDSDWSWTARLAYKVSDTLNVYASYATGFKASSFNLSRDSRPTIADRTALISRGLGVNNLTAGTRFAGPEDSSVYELGIKGNWGIASANLTFFKQTIRDFQTNAFTGTGFIVSNADKQSTFGIEFDGQVKPTDRLTLTLAMT